MGGAGAVAYYSVAKRLANAILLITDPVSQSVYPQFTGLIAENKLTEMKTMLLRVSRFILPSAIAFLIVNFFINEWLITSLFGNEYLEAANPYLVLICNSFLMVVFFWRRALIQSLGLVKIRFFVKLVALVCGASIAYVLIPSMGATGLAIGLLASTGIIVLCFSLASYRELERLRNTHINP